MNPEGTYSATILRGETTVAGTGTKAMKVTCQIDHFGGSGKWTEVSPSFERDVFLYLSSAAMPVSEACLERWGFNGSFGSPVFTNEAIELVCTHENFKGKIHEKWNAPRQGGKLADVDDIRTLDAEWRAKHTQPARPDGAPATPPVAAAQAPPVTPTPEGEGIPF